MPQESVGFEDRTFKHRRDWRLKAVRVDGWVSRAPDECTVFEDRNMNASREMPKYVCHKKVWALKIAEITEPTDATGTSRTIIPADEGYGPFVVDGAYMAKHKPEVGGYYVVYEDGYKSFSPASAFESGYTRV